MRLEHEILELRTRHTFNIARMKGDFARRTVHVRVIADDGVEGWGEAPVSTPYYGETADTVVAVLPVLQNALTRAFEDAGGDVLPIEVIEASMNAAIGYNRGAKVAVSAALHDLLGKRVGEPLWRMWDLESELAPPSSYTIGIDEPALMAERAREAARFPILKIKIGTDRDEEMLRAVRDAAPDIVLKVDANTAWTADQAIERLSMLKEFDVELLEQPLHPDDLDGLKKLRKKARIPIIADESCLTLADVHRLAGKVDGINIKLAKCGSLLEAKRMIEAAREHKMEVMLGCMLETTLGIAAGMQIAPLVDHLDLDGALLLAEDPFDGPQVQQDGCLTFNEEPGLGVRKRATAKV